MTAISGVYENGNFRIFGDTIPKEITKAKLYIVMIPEDEENHNEALVGNDNPIVAVPKAQ